MKFFLIGIKGSGMSALANMLINLEHDVSGIDYDEYFFTMDTMDKRIKIYNNDDMIYDESYYYIIGNAFARDIRVKRIINKGYRYDYYPKFINNYFKEHKIAISGTHGKTTTTKMIGTLSNEFNYLVGDGTGFANDKNKYFVFEACEYKDTFLNYYPDILVIMNIDYDHPDYFSSINDCEKSFMKLSEQSQMVIYNGDDKYASKVNVFNKLSFGLNPNNDVYATYEEIQDGYLLNVNYYGFNEAYKIPYYGITMIYNFLAMYSVYRYLGYNDAFIKNNLANIILPIRRMEEHNYHTNKLVLDYAHHPNEIIAFYNSINHKYKELKKIIIFEPHTLSRTIRFKRDFKEALKLFDEVYLYDLFSSVRENNDLKTEKELYDYFGFNRYNKENKQVILTNTNSVICFVGAGVIDLEVKKILK